jgi:hypothetical protein
MKLKEDEINKLCRTCRKKCKQLVTALVASCPQYIALPLDLRTTWKQQELPLWGKKTKKSL